MFGLGDEFIEGLTFLSLAVVYFVIAKYCKEVLTPYDDNDELHTKKNIAVAISMSGYLIAVVVVLLGAMVGPSTTLIDDIYLFTKYALLGIVLLNLSRYINDKLILKKFCNNKEIAEDQNAGAGFIEFGSYLASGFVVAGSISGQGGGLDTAIAFYVLSQVSLIVFTMLYGLFSPFDFHKEIEEDNVAAGVAFGGTLVALGVILLKGSIGNFVSWQYNLTNFALSVLTGFLFLPAVRFLLDKIIVRGIDLNREISEQRNTAVAIIEVTVALSFATLLYFTIDFDI